MSRYGRRPTAWKSTSRTADRASTRKSFKYPPPVTDPDRLNFERGLGIPLIRTLVDSASFVRKESGTSVRMTVFGGPVDGDDTAAIYIDVSKMRELPPMPPMPPMPPILPELPPETT